MSLQVSPVVNATNDIRVFLKGGEKDLQEQRDARRQPRYEAEVLLSSNTLGIEEQPLVRRLKDFVDEHAPKETDRQSFPREVDATA